MKKLVAFLLALVMICSLSAVAFADTFTGANGTGNVGINADYTAATDNKEAINNGAPIRG